MESHKKMKQKNILVLGIIVVIIFLGAVLILREDIIPEPVFVEDETIAAEFCRKAITTAQLRKILNYDGNFVFEDREDKISKIGVVVKTCIIDIAEIDEPIEMGVRPGMGIAFFPLDVTYEVVKEKLAGVIIPGEIKEVEGIGEKAFSISAEGGVFIKMQQVLPEIHQIFFLEPDANQVIGITVRKFSYEVSTELAKQIEKNLR